MSYADNGDSDDGGDKAADWVGWLLTHGMTSS